jgi:hypothetical protein
MQRFRHLVRRAWDAHLDRKLDWIFTGIRGFVGVAILYVMGRSLWEHPPRIAANALTLVSSAWLTSSACCPPFNGSSVWAPHSFSPPCRSTRFHTF